MKAPIKLGILISGGGTTFANIHEHIQAGKLHAQIACVISSKRKAAGLEKARDWGYPTAVVRRPQFDDDASFSREITNRMREQGAELIVLAGFLRKYLPGPPYQQACINIHPSLIPAFCGKGYYGMKVHEAVFARSCKISGCTVHLVNDEYDGGPIIIQKACPITDRDQPEDIRQKVFALECKAMPEAIQLFAEERIQFEDGRSIIRSR